MQYPYLFLDTFNCLKVSHLLNWAVLTNNRPLRLWGLGSNFSPIFPDDYCPSRKSGMVDAPWLTFPGSPVWAGDFFWETGSKNWEIKLKTVIKTEGWSKNVLSHPTGREFDAPTLSRTTQQGWWVEVSNLRSLSTSYFILYPWNSRWVFRLTPRSLL